MKGRTYEKRKKININISNDDVVHTAHSDKRICSRDKNH